MRIKDYLMRIMFYLVLGSGAFGFVSANSGCTSSRHLHIPAYRMLVKTEEKRERKNRTLEALIENLKAYTYSFYDLIIEARKSREREPDEICFFRTVPKDGDIEITVETMKLSEILPWFSEEILKIKYIVAKRTLKDFLAKHHLGNIKDLDRGVVPKELKDYFSNFGLLFEHFNIGEQNLPINYSLRKILKKDCVKVKLWGKEFEAERVVLGKSIIKSFTEYLVTKVPAYTDLGIEIGGAALLKRKTPSKMTIEFYPCVAEEMTKGVYEGINRLRSAFEKLIRNPNRFDPILRTDKANFYLLLARTLRYIGLKEISNKDFKTFKERFVRLAELETNIEEIQHANDFKDINLENLTKKERLLLHVHVELRGLLARLYHLPMPMNMKALGEAFALLRAEKKGFIDEHTDAARVLIAHLLGDIIQHPELYPNIDYSIFKPRKKRLSIDDCRQLLKQFVRLTPEQIKEAAKRIYLKIYGNKSLGEFFNRAIRAIYGGQR